MTTRNGQLGIRNTKTLLYSKANNQYTEWKLPEWETIFANYTSSRYLKTRIERIQEKQTNKSQLIQKIGDRELSKKRN